MTNNSTKSPVLCSEAETAVHLLDDWFDPIEAGLRDRVRELIQTMIESELEAVLSRPRYGTAPILTFFAVNMHLGFAIPMLIGTIVGCASLIAALLFSPETRGKQLVPDVVLA